MRLLLTGGTGLLGFDLLQRMPPHWDVVVTLHRNQALPRRGSNITTVALDLTDRQRVVATVANIRPDAVVHTASLGDLDYCEHHREEAWAVNVVATRGLLEACREFDPLFVFTSTIYVFDGRNPPYDEEADPNPLSYYARTKVEAEELVLQLSRRPVILRPMTMYGWHHPRQRSNCVTWLLRKLTHGEAVKVVNDLFNNHLWVGDASQAVLAVIRRQACGVFHLGGSETLSRYELSLKVADIFGFDQGMISPVTSDYFPSLAPRPRDTTCTIDKLRKVLGIVPLSLECGLHLMRATVPAWAEMGLAWSGVKSLAGPSPRVSLASDPGEESDQ